MKKRIGILVLLLFVCLGFTACKKDPYSKMSMQVSATEVNLELTEIDNEIMYGNESIIVSLDSPKGVSNGIVLPKYGSGYGDEYVDVEISNSDGKGKYQLTLTAKKQGQTQIQVKSAEGYLSKTIKVNIDVSLTGLNASGVTPVVEIGGGALDFNLYGKNYVNFVPTYTTQTRLEFVIDKYEELCEQKGSNFSNFISMENNVLTIKEGYSPTGSQKTKLTIKAISLDNPLYFTTFDISIIEPINLKNISSKMYYNIQNHSGNVVTMIQKDNSTKFNVYYEAVFASPTIDMVDAAEIEAILKTPILGGTLNFDYGNANYEIVYVNPDSTKSTIADITPSIFNPSGSKNQSFEIQANDAGEYNAKFRVEYVGNSDNYELIEKTINVKITVVALPTSSTILINDEAYTRYSVGNKSLAVYDAYATDEGTKLKISTTATDSMKFNIVNWNSIPSIITSDTYGISDTAIDIRNNRELVSNQVFDNEESLIIQNKTGKTDTVELEIQLTTKIWIDRIYYDNVNPDNQQFTKIIKLKLNLITGLSSLTLNDKTLDVVNNAPNKDGVLLHKFNDGVSAESVVDRIEASDTSLFSVKYVDNQIYLYATPYVEGSEFIKEGKSTIVIYLTNGIRSYTVYDVPIPGSDPPASKQESRDTVITVSATYEEYDVGGGNIKLRYATNIDTASENILGYGQIQNGVVYDSQYASANYVDAGASIEKLSNDGYPYKLVSSLILATNSQIEMNLYKIFIYDHKIKYVNPNQLTIISSNSAIARWTDGEIYTFADTTYDSVSKNHNAVIFEIMDGENKLGEITVYVVHKIVNIQIVQENFELYDEGSLSASADSVYYDKSNAKIEFRVFTNDSSSAVEITEDNIGEFGNFYQLFNIVNGSAPYGAGHKDHVLARSQFFDGYETSGSPAEPTGNVYPQEVIGETYKQLTAKADYAKIGGAASADTKLENLYTKDGYNGLDFQFVGEVKQFNQSFEADFNINIKYAIKTTNIYVDVNKDNGIYFESEGETGTPSTIDDFDKKFNFTYTIFPSNSTFRDVFVDIFKTKTVELSTTVNYALSYYDYERNGYYTFNKYTSEITNSNEYKTGFDKTKFMSAGSELTDLSNIDFIVLVSDTSIEVRAYKNIAVGDYIVRVGSVDSYANFEFGVYSQFNVYFADGTSDAPYQIRSASAFYEFIEKNANHSGKYYVLASDIHLGKSITTIKPLQNNLSGIFEKRYTGRTEYIKYAVYNLSINLRDLTEDSNIGLFSDILGGYELSYLTVSNIDVNVSASAGTINIGGIVGNLTDGRMIGCKVDGYITVTNTDNAIINAGGMAGKYLGGTLSELPDDNININNSDINSIVSITYYTKNNISANLGGIAGSIVNTSLNKVRAIATIVAIKDDSSQDYAVSNIGGIAGYMEDASVSNVISYPIVVGHSNVGGIVGELKTTTNNTDLHIEKSQVQMLYNGAVQNVIAGYDNIGGIVGHSIGRVNISYSYLRSYISKDFYKYQYANNEFHMNYINTYHGAVVLLGDINNASIGGIAGKSENLLNLDGCYVMSHVVSMNSSPNLGGIVGTKVMEITLNNSYIDGKLAYFVDNQKVDSFNIITASIDSRQTEFKSASGNTTIKYGTNGNLDNNVDSYVVITRTKSTKSSVVEYKDKIGSLTGSKFYARVNGNLFGIADSITGLGSNANTFVYRGYSAKVEKLTAIIYRTNNNLNMVAKNEVLDVTPGYSSYTIKSLSGTGSNEGVLSRVSETIATELLAMGLYNDGYRYLTTSTTTTYNGNVDNDDTLTDGFVSAIFASFDSIAVETLINKCNKEFSAPAGSNVSDIYNVNTVKVIRTAYASYMDIDNERDSSGLRLKRIEFDGHDSFEFSTGEFTTTLDTLKIESNRVLYVYGYEPLKASDLGLLGIVNDSDRFITNANGEITHYFAKSFNDIGADTLDRYVWELPKLIYEETLPINDGKVEINGITYSVVGGQIGEFDNDGVFHAKNASEIGVNGYYVNQHLNITAEDTEISTERIPDIMDKADLEEVFKGFNPFKDNLDDNATPTITQLQGKYGNTIYTKFDGDWYTDVSSADSNILEENLTSITVIYDDVTYSYNSSKWYDESSNEITDATLISELNIQLNSRIFETEYNGEDYVRINGQWYLKATNLTSLDVEIIENNLIIDRNFTLSQSIQIESSHYSNFHDLRQACETAGYGIYIENNTLIVVDNDFESGDSTIDLESVTYKLIGQSTISDSWLITDKLNNNLPVIMISNYNMQFNVNSGVFTQKELLANYNLLFDTLATLSLNAKPFEKKTGQDDYISSEGTHGHIRVDETSVVLMYNNPISLALGEKKDRYNTYKMSFGEKINGYYFANLNGQIVDLTTIKIDKDSALQLVVKSSDTGIVSIKEDGEGFKVIVNGVGEANLNFYNRKDDSISVSLKVYVVKGFTNFQVRDDEKVKDVVGGTITLETLVSDNPSNYIFGFTNTIGGNTFEANNGGYKLILNSIDGISTAGEIVEEKSVYSVVKINGTTINIDNIIDGNIEFNFGTSFISIQGINRYPGVGIDNGKLEFTVMPYIICNGVEVEVSELAKTIVIQLSNPAIDISFTENKTSFSPTEEKEVSINVITNSKDEGILLMIEGTDIVDGMLSDYILIDDNFGYDNYTDGVSLPKNASNPAKYYSILKFRLKYIITEPIIVGGSSMYSHTFVLVFSMNYDNYRIQTLDSGINAVVDGREYRLSACPESHIDPYTGMPKQSSLVDTFDMDIQPVNANSLDFSFYPYLQDKDISGNQLDDFNDPMKPANILAITPGDYGLLKLELGPKFSDVLSLEILVDANYNQLFELTQITPIVDDDPNTANYKIIEKQNIHNKNSYLLWEVPYEVGGSWFFGEYFVALFVKDNCPQGIYVPFTFNVYNGQRDIVLTKTMNLYIENLPYLSLTIDGTSSVIYGVDEYARLDIDARHIELSGEAGESFTLTIKKEADPSSNATLPLYYLNDGNYEIADFDGDLTKTYYVKTTKNNDYLGSLGRHTITIHVRKIVNGHFVETGSMVIIQVVWMTFEKIIDPDEVNGVISMKTGMYKGLDGNITTNLGRNTNTLKDSLKKAYPVTMPTVPGLSNIGLSVGSMDKLVDVYINYMRQVITGRGEFNNNFWSVLTDGGYSELTVGKTYSGFKFTRYDGANEKFYRISAINVSNNEIQLSFNYYYDENGIFYPVADIKNIPAAYSNYLIQLHVYSFKLNIKQNSTEDAPVPIYDEEDLKNMEKGESYILQQDITLTKWTPMRFNSAYLDGNGFVITVNSFDLTELKGGEEVYAGIFDTIEENSIIKNLNVNIAPLLYSDAALSKVLNGTTTPNIDLLETPEVYFGVLAGQNDGIIINVKIINLDSRKSNNTLYVAISRNYFTYDEENITSKGQVGGMVSINNGVITNSFIGVNEQKQLNKTQVVGTSNDFNDVYTVINPFKLESSNNVAGFAYSNGGTISNCYVKDVSINNDSRISTSSSTAGFVGINSGEIYSCAATSTDIVEYKAKNTLIVSSSNTGGFVYQNSNVIEDSYTTLQIDNKNVQTAGFVFDNESGKIKNSYTTSKNISLTTVGNTNSHSLFAGNNKNYGQIDNSYYLIWKDELGADVDIEVLRNISPAIGVRMQSSNPGDVQKTDFGEFNFATAPASYDGVWYLDATTAKFPQLAMAEGIDYYSSRSLADINVVTFEIGTNQVEVTNGQSGADREVIETVDLRKYANENIWYFFDGDLIFQVDTSRVGEDTAPTVIEITKGQYKAEPFIPYDYLSGYYVIYNSNNASDAQYQIYFTQDPLDSNYHKVNILNGSSNKHNNYVFKYLGFEFLVIECSGNYKVMYLNIEDEFEVLTNKSVNHVEFGESSSSYAYSYIKNNPGSKYNPLIVTNSEQFARYIVNNTNEYVLCDNYKVYIFGLTENLGDNVNARYVQLANNINFRNDEGETDRNIAMSYEVNNSLTKITINDVIFNGVMLGNAMSINNIVLNSSNVRDNYGIFSEVGINDGLRWELREIGITHIETAKIFNLKLNYQELSNQEARRVGLLAGTISNATVNKVDIVGVNQVDEVSQVVGKNLVGSLAGLVTGDVNNTKISEITASNVNVLSALTNVANLGDTTIINGQSYNNFQNSTGNVVSIKRLASGYYTDRRGVVHNGLTYYRSSDGSIHKEGECPYAPCSCDVYCNDTIKVIGNINELSYAGGVVGAIALYASEASTEIDTYESYKTLRKNDVFNVSDLSASGMVVVQSAISGGIAGYVGGLLREDDPAITNGEGIIYVNNLNFELSKEFNQSIFGYAYAGGVVGQTANARFMKVNISHSKAIQDEIDKKINTIKDSDISNNTLFGKMDDFGVIDTSKYNVAIGGIVGYMTNSWLVDATSKTNVVNKNSYIAGGVVGRIDDTAYLAYVYAIGNVKAKNIIGGLIGYYYNTGTLVYDNSEPPVVTDVNVKPYDLHLYNTFATNVWSSEVKNLLLTNEKAMQIYDADKNIWKDNIYEMDPETGEPIVKPLLTAMPELGNQQLNHKAIEAVKVKVVKFAATSAFDRFMIQDITENKYYSAECGYYEHKGHTFKAISESKVLIDGNSYSFGNTEITLNADDSYGIRINTKNAGVFTPTERFTYIGSVLGRYTRMANGKEELFTSVDLIDSSLAVMDTPYSSDSIKINTFNNTMSGSDTYEIISKTRKTNNGISEEYYTYFNKFNFNVISATYGGVSHEGSIEQGDLESKINDDKLNLSYFNSSYDIADDGTHKDYAKYNNHDISSYYPVFGKQYYMSYITGDYVDRSNLDYKGNQVYENEFEAFYGFAYDNYKIGGADWLSEDCPQDIDDAGISTSQWTKNVDANADTYLSYASLKNYALYYMGASAGDVTRVASLNLAVLGAGMAGSTNWYVDDGYYLAKYGYNTNDTFGIISTEEDLKNALRNGQSGKTYRIEDNINHMEMLNGVTNSDFVAACGSTDAKVYHINDWKLVAGTRINITNNTYYASVPTTIIFTVNNEDQFANLFNIITGCTFININFVVNIGNLDETGNELQVRTSNSDGYFGFLASVINGCTFSDCNFEITGGIASGKEIIIPSATGTLGAPTSFGIVFGQVMNSVLTGCDLKMNNHYEFNTQYSLKNFGIFAGNIYQTTLTGCELSTSSVVITYTTSELYDKSEHNWGSMIGLAQSTRINNSTLSATIEISGIFGSTTYNIGVIGQIASNTIIIDTAFGGNVAAGRQVANPGNNSTFNVGVIGYVNKADSIESCTYQSTIQANVEDSNLNIGMYGRVDGRNSGTSLNSTYMSTNGKIQVYFGGNNAGTLNVGGVVGYKASNSLTLQKIKQKGTITVTASKGTLNAGGLVGNASSVTIKQSYSLNSISINGRSDSELTTRVGGLVGYSSSSVKLDTVINYSDIYFYLISNPNYYVGGLIGLANRNIEVNATLALGNLINGETPVEAVKNNVHGMFNQGRSANLSQLANSHYVAEHDPYHAYSDGQFRLNNADLFNSVAWQYVDFIQLSEDADGIDYNTDSESNLQKLYTATKSDAGEGVTDNMKLVSGAGKLPKVDGLGNITSSESKFNPTIVNKNSSTTTINEIFATQDATLFKNTLQYVVLTDSIKLTDKFTGVSKGSVLTSIDKVGGIEIKLIEKSTGSSSYIGENNGTISNILFGIYGNSYSYTDTNNYTYSTVSVGELTIMEENNGNLMNVAFYNTIGNEFVFDDSVTTHKFTAIGTNTGNILATGTSFVFKMDKGTTTKSGTGQAEFTATEGKTGLKVGSGSTINYFVGENCENALIKLSYTTSKFVVDAAGSINFSAIANENEGTISYTYFGGSIKSKDSPADLGESGKHLVKDNSGKLQDSYVNSTYNTTGSAQKGVSYIGSAALKRITEKGGSWNNHFDPNSTSRYNGGYPHIREGIKIPTQQGSNWQITCIQDLQDFLYWLWEDGRNGIYGANGESCSTTIRINLKDEEDSGSWNFSIPLEKCIQEIGYNARISGYIVSGGCKKTTKLKIYETLIHKNKGELTFDAIENIAIGTGSDEVYFIESNETKEKTTLPFVNSDIIGDDSTAAGIIKENKAKTEKYDDASLEEYSEKDTGEVSLTLDGVKLEGVSNVIHVNHNPLSAITITNGEFVSDNKGSLVYENHSIMSLNSLDFHFNGGALVADNKTDATFNIVRLVNSDGADTTIGTNAGTIDGLSTTVPDNAEAESGIYGVGISLTKNEGTIKNLGMRQSSLVVTTNNGTNTKSAEISSINMKEVRDKKCLHVETNGLYGIMHSLNISGGTDVSTINNSIIKTNNGEVGVSSKNIRLNNLKLVNENLNSGGYGLLVCNNNNNIIGGFSIVDCELNVTTKDIYDANDLNKVKVSDLAVGLLCGASNDFIGTYHKNATIAISGCKLTVNSPACRVGGVVGRIIEDDNNANNSISSFFGYVFMGTQDDYDKKISAESKNYYKSIVLEEGVSVLSNNANTIKVDNKRKIETSWDSIGGIVGSIGFDVKYKPQFALTYADVHSTNIELAGGEHQNIGGVIGWNQGKYYESINTLKTTINCSANITTKEKNSYVGGIVGKDLVTTSVANSVTYSGTINAQGIEASERSFPITQKSDGTWDNLGTATIKDITGVHILSRPSVQASNESGGQKGKDANREYWWRSYFGNESISIKLGLITGHCSANWSGTIETGNATITKINEKIRVYRFSMKLHSSDYGSLSDERTTYSFRLDYKDFGFIQSFKKSTLKRSSQSTSLDNILNFGISVSQNSIWQNGYNNYDDDSDLYGAYACYGENGSAYSPDGIYGVAAVKDLCDIWFDYGYECIETNWLGKVKGYHYKGCEDYLNQNYTFLNIKRCDTNKINATNMDGLDLVVNYSDNGDIYYEDNKFTGYTSIFETTDIYFAYTRTSGKYTYIRDWAPGPPNKTSGITINYLKNLSSNRVTKTDSDGNSYTYIECNTYYNDISKLGKLWYLQKEEYYDNNHRSLFKEVIDAEVPSLWLHGG